MERGMERAMEQGTRTQNPCWMRHGTGGTDGTGTRARMCTHAHMRTHARLCGRTTCYARSICSMCSIYIKNNDLEKNSPFHTPSHARSIGEKVSK